MKHTALGIIAGLLIGGGFGTGAGLAIADTAKDAPRVTVPRCEEDEVLIGRGDFERGRWSAYACTHPDSL